MTIGRRAFMRLAACLSLAPAIALSVRHERVEATVTDLAQSPVAGSNAADNVVFYIAGWETPAPCFAGIDQIPIRLDRAWRASRR